MFFTFERLIARPAFDLPPDVFYARSTGRLDVFPFKKRKKNHYTNRPTCPDLPPDVFYAHNLHLTCFRLALDLTHDVFYVRTTARKRSHNWSNDLLLTCPPTFFTLEQLVAYMFLTDQTTCP